MPYNSKMHLLLLFVAKYLFIGVGLIAVIYWLNLPKKEKIRLAVFGLIAAVISFVLVKLGAVLYFDPRPFVTHHVTPLFPHGADNGFPSDHTVLTAFMAVTIYSANKRLGLVLFLMALLIGLSRIIGHIHSPIDIIGSVVFALVGGGVAAYLTPKVIARYIK